MRPFRRYGSLTLLTLGCALLGPPRLLEGQSPAAHTVDQRQACLNCHDLALGARVQHPPVEAAECSACHNPHAARLSALLRDRPAMLCGRCHSEMADTLARANVHPPVAEGRCGSCHDPHSSEHDGLLVAAGIEVCSSCHEQIGAWQGRDIQHSPFRRGQCARCHDPHAGNFPALALANSAEICGSCHPSSAKFRTDHGGFPVETAACNQCHDPHASSGAGLFRGTLHAPFDGGDCSTCHAGSGGAAPFALVSGQAELCGDCHEQQVAESVAASFPHVSAGGGSCTSCHNPHAGEGSALLNDDQASVCLGCHDPGGSKSGIEGRFSSHSDLDCAQCHNPHGGNRPLLLAEDPILMCNECHGHQHKVSHPMGADRLDPRNGRPLDCLSCHGIHEAPAEKFLHASGKGELCIGCHKEIQF
jgi:predicted CXXCH cytochrome family protein